QLASNSPIGGFNTPWASLYNTVANVNFFLEKTAEIPDEKFIDNRKKELLAEGHFLRGVCYYYLAMAWGDVPLVMELKTGGPEDNPIAKSSHTEVLARVKAELTIAADQTELEVEIIAAADAAVAKTDGITVSAKSKYAGKDVSAVSAAIAVEVKAAE
ncbi:MAG: hypothetical protein HOB20_01665, partial [Planctomycetaceae bacterium]|nr:hypothetical protein [Planctomycetaceae bacterium]